MLRKSRDETGFDTAYYLTELEDGGKSGFIAKDFLGIILNFFLENFQYFFITL